MSLAPSYTPEALKPRIKPLVIKPHMVCVVMLSPILRVCSKVSTTPRARASTGLSRGGKPESLAMVTSEITAGTVAIAVMGFIGI